MAKDLMAELSAEAADLKSIPSEQGMARLRKLGVELVEVDQTVTRLTAELAAANARFNELVHKEMPDLMAEIGQDRIGLPNVYENGADLVSQPYYKANIAAEWPPEQREAAFDYLDKLGAAEIVKNVVSLPFSRGQALLARAFVAAVQSPQFVELLAAEAGRDVNDYSLPPVEVGKSVPWGTLTAYVKEQIEKGTVLDLPKLGATVGTVVKIKPRKAK